ncbi:MAG: hypothetical protein HY901_08660 [Deltaproteobacteria bacterium]|nr:hypothetical protein [Deltaproteobacteria bacterium]
MLKDNDKHDWREGAVYSRSQVEQLISDPPVPEERRVLDAVLLIAGVRPGESFALRWRNYDPTLEPLGRLDVARSFNSDVLKERSTETGNRQLVPVHPPLAGSRRLEAVRVTALHRPRPA